MTPTPLATSTRGAPILFGALGLSLHLEALAPDDGERLTAACARILEWIGPSLRFTWSSVDAEVRAFRPDDFDFVSTLPDRLRETDSALHDSARGKRGAAVMAASKLDRFGIACHGGGERNDASPWSFRAYLTAVPPKDGDLLVTRAMISLTMPESFDPADFAARAIAVATELRLRWGAAGLAYGGWELDRYGETRDAIFAHARRHPGYDIGQHATLMDAWHERMRTVSFLSFVGPALRAHLSEAALGAGRGAFTAEKAGEATVFRAGDKPLAGDVNRDDIPGAYAAVDRALRPIRAQNAHFMAPWSEKTSAAWLARFERGAP